MDLLYKGKKITKYRAINILNSERARQLEHLVKSKYATESFPFSPADWNKLSVDTHRSMQVDEKLHFLVNIPKWATRYVLALNIANDTSKNQYESLIKSLENWQQGVPVDYDQMLENWKEFIVISDKGNKHESNSFDDQNVQNVLDVFKEVKSQKINLNTLYWRTFEDSKYLVQAKAGLRSTEDNAVQMLKELLDVARNSVQKNELDKFEKYREFILQLREKNISFTNDSFKRYEEAWELRWLRNQLNKLVKESNKRMRRYGLKNVNRPKIEVGPSLTVQDFFDTNATPDFDFPFNLVSWMSLGETLARGDRVKVLSFPGMRKIQAEIPAYADYLINVVGQFDVASLKEHIDSWNQSKN